jgi:hypothetical protein
MMQVHLDRSDADAARADLDSARVNGASEQDVQAGMEHAHALRQSSSCDRGYPAGVWGRAQFMVLRALGCDTASPPPSMMHDRLQRCMLAVRADASMSRH